MNAVLILLKNLVKMGLGVSERQKQLAYLRPTVLPRVRIAQLQANPEVYAVVSKAVLVPQFHQVFAAKSVAALQTLYPLLTSMLVKISTIVVITPVAENANLVAAKARVGPKKERRRSPRIPEIQMSLNITTVRAKSKEAKAGPIENTVRAKAKDAKSGPIQNTVRAKAKKAKAGPIQKTVRAKSKEAKAGPIQNIVRAKVK